MFFSRSLVASLSHLQPLTLSLSLSLCPRLLLAKSRPQQQQRLCVTTTPDLLHSHHGIRLRHLHQHLTLDLHLLDPLRMVVALLRLGHHRPPYRKLPIHTQQQPLLHQHLLLLWLHPHQSHRLRQQPPPPVVDQSFTPATRLLI